MKRRRYPWLKTYTETGQKYIYCRGRSEDVFSLHGKCRYPVALSDGKTFFVIGEAAVKHCRRGKVTCPKCNYVTTLSPKML